MALKTILDEDQFGELDESTKELYRQTEDGKYALDVEDIDNHPAVAQLRSGHKNSKRERDDAKKRVDNLRKRLGPLAEREDLDLSTMDEESLEALLPYLTGEKELPREGDGGEGGKSGNGNNQQIDIEKIKANARKPVERERDELKQRAERAEQERDNLVVHSALSSAISEIKVHGPYWKAVRAMFKDRVKVSRDDDGNPVALIEGEYGEQPVDKYLKEWAQTDEGKAFIEADRNGGGGARGGSGSGKVKNPWSPDNWNMMEQARIYREDPERAKRMAAEHGKRVA